MHLHEILDAELSPFGNRPLLIIETGTIRNATEDGRIGDGWSTVWFAERACRAGQSVGSIVSIDLDTSVARHVLTQRRLLEQVTLVELHSIAALARIATQRGALSTDVFLLDSDNDPQLILHEFLIARELVKPGGLILIDDVAFPDRPPTGARKGELVLPYIKDTLKLKHRLNERTGWNGYTTAVLAVDC